MISIPFARRLVDSYLFGVFSATLVMMFGTQAGYDARAIGGLFLLLAISVDIYITYLGSDLSGSQE